MLSLYGNSLTTLLKRKLLLDNFFFNTLTFLELRFSTIALRMFFFFNLLKIIKEIQFGNITVNGKKKHKTFLVRINSIICYCKGDIKKKSSFGLILLNIIKIHG